MYLFEEVSKLLNNDVVFVLILFLISISFIKSHKVRKKFILYFIGLIAFTLLLKFTFFEERICNSSIIDCPKTPSFPSGHVMLSFSTALFFYRDRDSLLVMSLLAMFISLTRLYLGVHSLIDLSAGFAFSMFYFSIWWKNGRL